MPDKLTHLDDHGAAQMVDVGDKPVTERLATASGQVRMAAETLRLIREDGLAKGQVLQVARLAGVMAAKRTDQLIPLCHTLPLDSVEIAFDFPNQQTLGITATTRVTGKTGVEMEALTAVTIAALTVYDMAKAVDRGMVIGPVRLEEKQGGRSGHWIRGAAQQTPGDGLTDEPTGGKDQQS